MGLEFAGRAFANAACTAAVVAFGISIVSSSATSAGEWIEGAPMPTARSEIAAATLDGKIYVGGSLLRDHATAAFEVYDTEADRWGTLNSLPLGLHHLGMAVLGGKVYIVGGFTDFSFTPNVRGLWVYAPVTDTWERLASMPLPRAAHKIVALNRLLFVVGGVGPQSQKLMAYVPRSNVWNSLLAPLPTPREHLAAAILDSKLYAIVGRWSGIRNLRTAEGYDPLRGSWSRLLDLPTPRSGLTAAGLRGRIYVAGKEVLGTAHTFGALEILTVRTNQWKFGLKIPTARHGLASAVFGCRIAFIGGATSAGRQTFTTLSRVVGIFEGACGDSI